MTLTLTSNVLPTQEQLSVMQTIAEIMLKSGFYPEVATVEKALAKILRGWGLGLSPADSLSGINILHGKLTMSSGLIAALMMRAGFSWTAVEHTEEVCRLSIEDSDKRVLGEVEFTIADAKRADLMAKNKNWYTYPKDMLFARTISAAARRFAPVAFGGAVYTPEELQNEEKAQPVRNERRLPVVHPATTNTDPQTGEITPAPLPPVEPELVPPAEDDYNSDVAFDDIPSANGKNAPLTKKQSIELHTIAEDMGMAKEERRDFIELYTEGRTRTSKELSIKEADEFIHLLKIEWAGQKLGDTWVEKTRDAIVRTSSGGRVSLLWHLRGDEINKAHRKVGAIALKAEVELPARLLPVS